MACQGSTYRVYCGELSTPTAELVAAVALLVLVTFSCQVIWIVQLNGTAVLLQLMVASAAGTTWPSAAAHCCTSYAATCAGVQTVVVAHSCVVLRMLVGSVMLTETAPGPVVWTATVK